MVLVFLFRTVNRQGDLPFTCIYKIPVKFSLSLQRKLGIGCPHKFSFCQSEEKVIPRKYRFSEKYSPEWTVPFEFSLEFIPGRVFHTKSKRSRKQYLHFIENFYQFKFIYHLYFAKQTVYFPYNRVPNGLGLRGSRLKIAGCRGSGNLVPRAFPLFFKGKALATWLGLQGSREIDQGLLRLPYAFLLQSKSKLRKYTAISIF